MKIKIGQFREIADILLQVHAYKKVILLWLQMVGKGDVLTNQCNHILS
jgi:hypothetical protein